MNSAIVNKSLHPPSNFDFPFTPYAIQHEFMHNLYVTLENKQLGIFESPTGTGKSLSIICAALRWLKDHNESKRQNLRQEIVTLEASKEKLLSSNEDWFTSQTQGKEVTHKLRQLQLQQNEIEIYDKKIESLLAKKSKIKKNWNSKKKQIKSESDEECNQQTNEDDILLEDGLPNDDDESPDEFENRATYEPVKILICSRTHSQLSQLVGEIIKSPFGHDTRAVSLASRQSYCINPSVTKLKSVTMINERCLDMQKTNIKTTAVAVDGKSTKRQKVSIGKCPYYNQEHIDELKDSALLQVQDIEDLLKNGKKLNACPYYASRKAIDEAEIVLVPYNTLLHKATREANGLKLNGNVIIIDEAHNLLEALAQMHNVEINYDQLQQAQQQLKAYKMKFCTRFSPKNLLCINQILFVLAKLCRLFQNITTGSESKATIFTVENFVLTANIDNYNMFNLLQFCKTSRIAQKLRSFAIRFPEGVTCVEKPKQTGVQRFLTSIENKENDSGGEVISEKSIALSTGNPFLSVISFFESLTHKYGDGRILIHTDENLLRSKFQFLLLNPASLFQDIVRDARAIIVAGGTMQPTSEFKNRLFISAGAEQSRITEFSCDHIIPSENILPIIITEGVESESLLFNYENQMLMGNSLRRVLIEACKKVPGGIVVFFPSYKYENWVWKQFEGVDFGRTVFREPKNSSGVDSVLENYARDINKGTGAMLFSVVGGKLSEGLNFSDDLGRCVIVVGLPYANLHSPELKEKMSYLDKHEGEGAGKKFYEALCTKSVNQCIGRAVRHKDDYATVILLDKRYDRFSVKHSLPKWIQRSLQTCNFTGAFHLIEKFFSSR